MNRPCFWKFIFLSVLSFSLCHSQETDQETPITFRLANGDTTLVHTLDSTEVLYLSLNDFLKPLHLPTILNDSTGKIECLIASQLVRFTNQNPFVVITDRLSNSATVYQMPTQVILKHGEFYIPALTFVALFERIADKPLLFDAERKTLELRLSTSPYDIAGIEIEKKLNGSLITILANKKLCDIET